MRPWRKDKPKRRRNRLKYQIQELRLCAGQIRHGGQGNLRVMVLAGEVEAIARKLEAEVDSPAVERSRG